MPRDSSFFNSSASHLKACEKLEIVLKDESFIRRSILKDGEYIIILLKEQTITVIRYLNRKMNEVGFQCKDIFSRYGVDKICIKVDRLQDFIKALIRYEEYPGVNALLEAFRKINERKETFSFIEPDEIAFFDQEYERNQRMILQRLVRKFFEYQQPPLESDTAGLTSIFFPESPG